MIRFGYLAAGSRSLAEPPRNESADCDVGQVGVNTRGELCIARRVTRVLALFVL